MKVRESVFEKGGGLEPIDHADFQIIKARSVAGRRGRRVKSLNLTNHRLNFKPQRLSSATHCHLCFSLERKVEQIGPMVIIVGQINV